MKQAYRRVKECRVCFSTNIVKYLDLGETPLANSLVDIKHRHKQESKFPLEVLYCKNCSLSQLSIVVNPKILFSRYVYHSSVSKTFQEHCAKMANKVIAMLGTGKNKLVVDIASNDGCLLRQFKIRGFKTLGVEPAENIVKKANANGIGTICAFWGKDVAQKISEKNGKAKVITATNILAHVDDLNEFLKAVNLLLDEDGLFVIEVPYLGDLLTKNEFDTIYHEHLSYFLVKPLMRLYNGHGLKIFRIEKYPIHGGSIRILASKNAFEEDDSVQKFLESELNKKLYEMRTYQNFEIKVGEVKNKLQKLLTELRHKNKKIAAYGASAKGNTLLNYCGIDSRLVSFIIDDTPEKQNHLAPGSRISIVDASYLHKENPDYLLLLAWNFAKEIMQKTGLIYKRDVKYIIPIPSVKVI